MITSHLFKPRSQGARLKSTLVTVLVGLMIIVSGSVLAGASESYLSVKQLLNELALERALQEMKAKSAAKFFCQ